MARDGTRVELAPQQERQRRDQPTIVMLARFQTDCANAGAEGDLANATAILLSAFERQGLRDGLAFMPALGVKRSDVVAAVEVQLARLMKRAIAIVEADRVVAVKLAKRLVAERVLSGADVKSALATARPSRKQHSARATSTSSAARTTT